MYTDFSEPSLNAGIALLRDSTKWPKGFKWNYTNSCKCAMGLFRDTWDVEGVAGSFSASKLLGIASEAGDKIFLGPAFTGRAFAGVTPEDVAAKLEELITP
jgi:hypothetical protein